jgi:hypothetical protein
MTTLYKEETQMVKVPNGTQCDVCGKTTKDDSDWVKIEHYHSAWGNDSCESFEYFDACSVDCYTEQLKRSIRELEGNHGGKINEMRTEFVVMLIERLEQGLHV